MGMGRKAPLVVWRDAVAGWSRARLRSVCFLSLPARSLETRCVLATRCRHGTYDLTRSRVRRGLMYASLTAIHAQPSEPIPAHRAVFGSLSPGRFLQASRDRCANRMAELAQTRRSDHVSVHPFAVPKRGRNLTFWCDKQKTPGAVRRTRPWQGKLKRRGSIIPGRRLAGGRLFLSGAPRRVRQFQPRGSPMILAVHWHRMRVCRLVVFAAAGLAGIVLIASTGTVVARSSREVIAVTSYGHSPYGYCCPQGATDNDL